MRHSAHLLAALIPALMYQAAANAVYAQTSQTTAVNHSQTSEDQDKQDQNAQDLGVLSVTADKSTPQGKLGERIINRQTLKEQNIQSAQDLVRYNTEVDVAEVGRYGNKGFAVRGVDGNRVAISIDGVSLPEVEVNELFSPYGYVYEGRFNPDTELMGSVRISAGADSIASGSGAVGGSVAYRTKEPSAGLNGKQWGGYGKVGYTNKNSELLTAFGISVLGDKREFLLNYARRDGHELKNHNMNAFNKARLDVNYDFAGNGEMGRASQPSSALYPDARSYQRDALLIKAYQHLNDQHRLGASVLYQKQNSQSFAFSQSNTGRLRMPKDQEKMTGYGLNYRFTPSEHGWLDRFDGQYQYQDILGLADTWLYGGFATTVLSAREYRPTQTKTHQLKLDAAFLPIDWEKFGTHHPKLSLAYKKQDFRSTTVSLGYTNDKIDYAIQPYAIYFPDAKKDVINLVASDDIQVNERLNAKLGLRYDYHKYSPYFQNDMWFGDIRSNEQYDLQQNINNPNLKFYEDYRNGVYDQSPTFDRLTYSAGFDYKLIPNRLTARYKFGTGFLAPTVNQMYSAFQGLGAQQIINTELNPETSVNHEVAFEFNYEPIVLTAGIYRSNYKNFIHSVYWDSYDKPALSARLGCRAGMTCIQSQNLDTANIQGIKLGVQSDLSKWLPENHRLYASADYHSAKDEAVIIADQAEDGALKINTLAAVPTSAVLGLDYHYKDKASVYLKGKFNAAKKPEDTKYVKTVLDNSRAAGYREEVATYEHLERGKDTWIVDLYGSYKLNKALTLQAGIYNLTDVNYIPWETLRQFGNISTNSPVDDAGYGFNRYSAPGRNYALALTYEF